MHEFHVKKSAWRERWHLYFGRERLATFVLEADARQAAESMHLVAKLGRERCRQAAETVDA